MLVPEPEGPYRVLRGVRRIRRAAGGARGEPARRGQCDEEWALRRAPGFFSPSHPEDARTPGSRWGRRHKVSKDEGRAGPWPPGTTSALEPYWCQVSSACPSPSPWAGGHLPVPLGSRLTVRPPARLPASADWPLCSPLLLTSARARGGPCARS
ncbi:hypothetical protein HJG60_011869 [Phyllostomus discolor]|uniref:Uncharacterized protein n=1 Tax=Phyllostomus discolor TaxID=89673 RepID=A0A833ZLP1_9CHIR|nr:hypothetical protein HJG60_011869 [Phyllostomus discolor]